MYFIGATLELNPGWQEFVPELKINSRLTDPVKIAEARADAAKTLAYIPITGRLSSVCVLDATGSCVLLVHEPGQQPGRSLAAFMATTFPKGLLRDPLSSGIGASVVGFNVRNILRIAAAEGIRDGVRSPIGNHWWGRYQDDVVAACDPYDDIFTTEMIKQVTVENVLRYFWVQPTNHRPPTCDLPGYERSPLGDGVEPLTKACSWMSRSYP